MLFGGKLRRLSGEPWPFLNLQLCFPFPVTVAALALVTHVRLWDMLPSGYLELPEPAVLKRSIPCPQAALFPVLFPVTAYSPHACWISTLRDICWTSELALSSPGRHSKSRKANKMTIDPWNLTVSRPCCTIGSRS